MILIRRMQKEDVPGAVAVENSCFAQPWDAEAFYASLLLPYARYYVTEEDGAVIGICGVRMVEGVGEITNVGVLPDSRRQGVAEGMLRVLIAQEKNPEAAFTLEVRAGNEAAVRLYEKLGFSTEGVRKAFYREPTEDALIMWRRGPVPAGCCHAPAEDASSASAEAVNENEKGTEND